MKEILLRGTPSDTVALVDDEDYEWLNRFNWSNHQGYVHRRKNKALPYGSMHRAILNAPKELCVDHIDGNPLNNQKSNLRLCTHAQNTRTAKAGGAKRHSKYRGVSKLGDKYIAYINIAHKQTNLGYFDDEEIAARVYDAAAKEHYGEFAVLNFPKERTHQ